MNFKIWRSGRGGEKGRYEPYQVPAAPGMSVLDALFSIRDEHDDSLAFRYSCRGAVCGSCAMTINREPRLACRTQLSEVLRSRSMGLRTFPGLQKDVEWDMSEEVLVEPLPNMPIIKDLVVDMSKFFEYYRRVKPWIDSVDEIRSFSSMTPVEVAKVQKYANCILCGACFGACPVCERDLAYLGPAALAWSLRMIDDPRTKERRDRLGLVSHREGVQDCEFIYNCVRVCPKAVAPAGAIRILKEILKEEGML